MSTLRLFVAIELPENIKKEILALTHSRSHIKWLKKEALHLTLKFIGEVDESHFKQIKTLLSQIESKSFSLSMTGVGCFDNRGRARVLWVGVSANDELTQLQKNVDRVLAEAKIAKPENRPYSPHITLARLKNMPLKKLEPYLEDHKEFNTESFNVNAFHLFSSKLTQSGAIHTIEQSYSLQDVPPPL